MITTYLYYIFCFKQKTAYEMRISDWSSDVCSSDLLASAVPAIVVDHNTTPADVAASPSTKNTRPPRSACSIKPSLTNASSSPCEIGRASCRERVCQYV